LSARDGQHSRRQQCPGSHSSHRKLNAPFPKPSIPPAASSPDRNAEIRPILLRQPRRLQIPPAKYVLGLPRRQLPTVLGQAHLVSEPHHPRMRIGEPCMHHHFLIEASRIVITAARLG